jgi:Tfp pilus assembly protein PilO
MARQFFRTTYSPSWLSLFVGVFALAFVVLWVSKMQNIQRLKREIDRLEKEVGRGQELWRSHPPLKPSERRALQTAQERLFTVLPKEKDVLSLLEEISRLAKEHNLVELSLNSAEAANQPGLASVPSPGSTAVVAPKPSPAPSPPVPKSAKPIESFPVKVAFAGDYRDIAYFLENLGELPRLVTIQSFKIQKGIPLLPTEVVLHAYYQRGELPFAGK